MKSTQYQQSTALSDSTEICNTSGRKCSPRRSLPFYDKRCREQLPAIYIRRFPGTSVWSISQNPSFYLYCIPITLLLTAFQFSSLLSDVSRYGLLCLTIVIFLFRTFSDNLQSPQCRSHRRTADAALKSSDARWRQLSRLCAGCSCDTATDSRRRLSHKEGSMLWRHLAGTNDTSAYLSRANKGQIYHLRGVILNNNVFDAVHYLLIGAYNRRSEVGFMMSQFNYGCNW